MRGNRLATNAGNRGARQPLRRPVVTAAPAKARWNRRRTASIRCPSNGGLGGALV